MRQNNRYRRFRIFFFQEFLRNSIFWAIFPNIAAGIFFFELALIQQDRATKLEEQGKIARGILSAASDVVFELYPPDQQPGPSPRTVSQPLQKAMKSFESLYWGELGLISVEPIEKCLTELHQTLLAEVQGYQSSTDPAAALQQLQYKLDAVSRGLREVYYGNSASKSADTAGSGHSAGASCSS